jgi:hypothetical protein
MLTEPSCLCTGRAFKINGTFQVFNFPYAFCTTFGSSRDLSTMFLIKGCQEIQLLIPITSTRNAEQRANLHRTLHNLRLPFVLSPNGNQGPPLAPSKTYKAHKTRLEERKQRQPQTCKAASTSARGGHRVRGGATGAG